MKAKFVPSTDFQLSRFYAKGWSAGTRCTVEEHSADVAALAAAHIPEATLAERARWAMGFAQALARNGGKRRCRHTSDFAPNAAGRGYGDALKVD